jgi:membrane-associated HD superfamily phosphohydrolase
MPKIRRELNIIGKDAIQALRIGGQPNADMVIDGGQFKLQETIEKVYSNTIKKSEKLLKDLYPDDKKKVAQVRRELERNFKKQAERAAKQISDSTKRQMSRVIESGRKNELTDAEIEKKLKKKIGTNSRRAQVISEVEIGSVTAEGRDKLSRKTLEKATRKVWVTARDSKVRDPHQHAEGQTVDINKNFILRGKRTERAPYPRYRGLSAGQRVNCRCKAIYLKD